MRASLRNICILCAMGAALAGCGRNAADKALEKAIERETGGNADVDVRDGAVRVETDEGTFETGGTTLPEGWPEDVTMYPGATIQSTATVNPATGEEGSVVILQTTDGMQKVSGYYAAGLKTAGWTVEGTANAGGFAVVSASKEGRTVSVMATGADGQTTITIGLGKKE